MSKQPTDVVIAAYLDTEPARLDCEAVKNADATLEGVICVSRDHAGKLHVEESDHLASRGAEVQAFDTIPFGEADGKKLDALKHALAEAQEQMKQPAQ